MHLSRKIFHASGIVIVLVWRLSGIDDQTLRFGLWGIVGLLALLDVLRAFLPSVQALFLASARLLIDPKDERGLNGSTLYFIGCALAATLFCRDEACGGILALAVGDSSAAVIGSSTRSPKWGRVSLAGSGACFVFSVAAIKLLGFPLHEALLGGLASALIEALSGSKLDNLTMPVGVALALYLVS